MDDADTPVVLIVEDEPDVAETYRRWLEGSYDVRLAPDGPAALDAVDETVDVVLLDRMMPGMSGQEVLAAIRERGLECRVAMVTAVDADFDVIEMGFDEYLSKPPERDELEAAVERLYERAALEDDMQEYYSLVARRSALQTAKTEAELAESGEYADLVDRIEAAETTVDEDLGDMADDTDFVGAVREIMDDDGGPADPSPTDSPSMRGEEE
ncbi:HalX domain-containing protein [Halomicrobium zhouii]|uniref:HalX domain-containing protein n=1 Tax=Halomicrobium zhouii TaxID=767519 RepID=A0A1I6LFN6_9EURY|nr:response regulator [Halomicrobium zhouii]SFS02301.1 HalX domain-containing protein [Halomicrobium zhouii]